MYKNRSKENAENLIKIIRKNKLVIEDEKPKANESDSASNLYSQNTPYNPDKNKAQANKVARHFKTFSYEIFKQVFDLISIMFNSLISSLLLQYNFQNYINQIQVENIQINTSASFMNLNQFSMIMALLIEPLNKTIKIITKNFFDLIRSITGELYSVFNEKKTLYVKKVQVYINTRYSGYKIFGWEVFKHFKPDDTKKQEESVALKEPEPEPVKTRPKPREYVDWHNIYRDILSYDRIQKRNPRRGYFYDDFLKNEDIIRKKLNDYEMYYEDANFKSDYYISNNLCVREFLWRESIYYGLPPRVRDLCLFSKKDKQVILNQNITSLLSEYSQNFDELNILIQQIRDNSIFPDSKKIQFYLQGEPGTGKTVFTQKLAKALNIPLFKTDMNTFLSGNLLNINYSIVNDENISFSNNFIVDCMFKSRSKNFVIFVDEAGDFFKENKNTELKLFLDPATQHITINYDRPHIDIGHIIFVFAGNFKIKDSALKSRLPQICFGKLNKDYRFPIAINLIDAELKKITFHFAPFVADIRKHCMDNLNYFIEKNYELFYGLRELKETIPLFVGYVRYNVCWENHEKLSGENCHKFIDSILLQRYMNIEEV